MTYSGIALKAHAGAGWCVALLGFSIPVSTALDGLLVALVILAWLVAAPVCLRESLRSYARVKPALIALLLFGALLMSCTYSPASWKEAWPAASKYLDLALIPVFIWLAAPRIRYWALLGYLSGIVLNLLVSYGTAAGVWDSIPGLHTLPHYPVGFRLSVTHNLLVSLGAFLLLLLARELRTSSPRAALLALGLALACIYNVLFIVIGRTGWIVLAALLVYFALTVVRSRRGALVAVLALTALFASAYLGSGSFSTRLQDIASDLTRWKPGAEDGTSVGQRIGYYRTTLEIIREHPFAGVGAGGYARAYEEKVRDTAAPATVNPHNDYLMLAAQAGLGAFLLLIALYVVAWRDARTLRTPLERDLVRGLVLAMAIAGVFNSALMDHVEGLLFAWGIGVLYAGAKDAQT